MPGLNLTAAQAGQIGNLREAYLKDIQPLQDKLYGKGNELRLLWLQQSPDEGKITALNREVHALQDQIHDKMTGQRLALFKVLTPEQQAVLKAYGAGRGYGYDRGIRGQGGMGMAPGMGWGMRSINHR